MLFFSVVFAGVFLVLPKNSGAQVIADGDLIKTAVHHNIYIVKIIGDPSAGSGQVKRFKRLILNPDIFNQYEHLRWENIKTVSESEFGRYQLYSLAREINDFKVYRLFGDGDTGTKRWLNITPQEFEAAGFDWDGIYIMNLNEHDSYVNGSEYNSQNLPTHEFEYGIIPGISSTNDVNKLQELGVNIVRLAPNDLSFAKNALSTRGIKIMVQKIDDTPQGSPGVPPPSNYQQWVGELKKLVQQHPDVIYWQVWNEPNEVGFWYPTPSASAYVELLKMAYEAVKEANPNAIVINGGLSGLNPPRQYLRDMYAAGASNYFDILALHPYGQPKSPAVYLEDYLRFMKNIMETYGDLEKDVWITEIGWPTDPDQFGAVNEQEQADYLRLTYEISFDLDFIKKVFWYRLQDAGEGMGILGKPAESVYKELAN